MLTLYQAEWCPFSAAARELLTEAGIDFVARQVEPWPEQRERLRAQTGTVTIPVLETEDGDLHRGTHEILRYVESLRAWEHAPEHRQRFVEHEPARRTDVTGQLVALAELQPPPPRGEDGCEVRDNPAERRHELWFGERLAGWSPYP